MDRIDEVRRRLEEDLPRLAMAHAVPGVSVAVLVDGHVVERAFGVVNLRTGVEVRPDALFMIQSITKVWTATLVMQLVDDGLVGLDAPVRTYLPHFRTADEPASADITVRHLLTHTAGFEGDIWAQTTCGDDALQRFVGDLVSHAPQHAGPGEMYSYCSAGYGVLGRLVEVLREMPYAAALRRHLAEPLGIDEIAFSADDALAFRTAIGHASRRPGEPEQPLRVWAVMPPSNPAAGNQLAMSARALLAFGRMHIDGGRATDGTQVLSATNAQAMRERLVDHPGAIGAPTGHGLGWILSDRSGLIGHGGDTIGVSALLQVVPDQSVAVVILANGGAAGLLIDGLVEPLLGDLAGIGRAPLPSPAATATVSDPARYVGRYRTRTAIYDVTVEDDGRMWLTRSAHNEALTMADAAGITLEPQRYELHLVKGDTFALTAPSGAARGAIEFLGEDSKGRARFLHAGRAAPRAD